MRTEGGIDISAAKRMQFRVLDDDDDDGIQR
jgi:hypothetical protein